jgi:hypothetical protein
MINKLKRKKQLVVLFLLMFVMLFSRGQDTIVRKKYLDSVKNQLAIYTVTSYTHLNMYDKSENEKLRLQRDLERYKTSLDYVVWRRQRENLRIGGAFVAMMIMSFIMVVKFSK